MGTKVQNKKWAVRDVCEIVGVEAEGRYRLKRPNCTTRISEKTLDREYVVVK